MAERARHRHQHATANLGRSGAVLGSALAIALTAAAGAAALAVHGHVTAASAVSAAADSVPRAHAAGLTLVPLQPELSVTPSPAVAAATDVPITPATAFAPTPSLGTRGVVAAGRGEGARDPARPLTGQSTAEPSTVPAPLTLAEPLPASGSALSAAPPPLEREHKVSPGETLSGIALRYGITPDTIVMNNAGVTDRDLLKVGQTLRIPPSDGLLYELRWGETLTAVAHRFGVDVAAIVREPANRIVAPDLVREGQVVFIPGAKLPPTVATTAPAAAPVQSSPRLGPTAAPSVAASQGRAGGGWMWPITGPISSYFGPSHPLGIDIDLYGRAGAPIVAARGGVVTFAGGNPCCSYGYYVEIDHGDGFRTLYAHLNGPPPVRIGQPVSQGQVVGYAGTTGYSTGVHLHFEIRRGGVPVNPLAYLP